MRLVQALGHDVRAGLVLVAAALFFHLPSWAAGLIPMEDDVRVFYFPLLAATSEALARGTLPLWTPNIFGGYPLFADGEGGMLYPLHLLLLPWLAPEASLVTLRVVHSALASIFTFQFLRELGTGRVGSLVAGLIYAYSGFAAGQVVHSNVVHSMTWLPLELLLVERACRAGGGVRYRYAMLAGVVFGIQGLALHVQITLLSATLVAVFLLYRGLARRSAADIIRGGASALGILTIVGLVGCALSAVQLMPLHELGAQSYRGGGLDRALAATNSVWPGGLLTLLLPSLYDTPAGGYWGPWVKWETILYVGIAPLVLAPLGLYAPSRRYRPFFGGLALLALMLTLGPDAPIPLWSWLLVLPGFGSLQSPGRFSLLLTLAVAVLAGYGVDWLERRRVSLSDGLPTHGGLPPSDSPTLGGLGGVPPSDAIAAAVTIMGASTALGSAFALEYASAALRAWSSTGAPFLEAYVHRPGVPTEVDGLPLTAARVGELGAYALSIANPATTWQVGLVLATALVVALWQLGPRPRRLASVAAPALVVLDLGMLWLTYHPYGQISSLRPEVPPPLLLSSSEAGSDPYRIFTPPTAMDKRTQVEPNRLLIAGMQEAGGYSSIEPARHLAYTEAVMYADNHLLDLWNVRYVVRRTARELLPSYALTSFVPDQPLFSGRRGNPGSGGVLLPDGGDARADALHVIAGLWDADLLADGATAARVILESPGGETQTLFLRVGDQVSDSGADVPGHTRTVQHRTAEVAFQYHRHDPMAPRYGQQLYHARLPVEPPRQVRRVIIETVAPLGGLEVFGVGLYDRQTGEMTQAQDKAKFRLAYRDAQLRVLENADVMPRAFVVDQAVIVPPDRNALAWMVDMAFDARTMVVLEDRGLAGTNAESPPHRNVRASGGGQEPLVATAAIASYANEAVTVRVTSDRAAYLVLTDPDFPGWVARLDGQRTPILAADYLFRAVAIPPGSHTVTFTFEPLSVARGGAVSGFALVVVFGITGAHAIAALRHRPFLIRRRSPVPLAEPAPSAAARLS